MIRNDAMRYWITTVRWACDFLEWYDNWQKKIIIIKRPFKDEFKRLKKLELNDGEIKKFIKICERNKVEPSITCFARENIQKLKDLGFKTIKIASYDCGSFQLIRELSEKFDNLIISTGATYDSEIIKTYNMFITIMIIIIMIIIVIIIMRT